MSIEKIKKQESEMDGAHIATLAAEARILRRLAAGLAGGFDMERIATTVVDTVTEEVGAQNCSLYLLDDHGRSMTLVAVRSESDSTTTYHPDGGAYKTFRLGEGICGLVARTGEPILVGDVREDSRFVRSTPFGDRIRSLLSVPLLAREKVIGVINLSHGRRDAFSVENEEILSLMSAQAGIALANVGLYTGLAEANERLALSEQRFRELFTRANDALVLIDREGHIVEANRRWEEFSGAPPDQWEELTVECPSGERMNLRDFLRRRAFVREGTRLEAAIVRPDGPTSMVEISSKTFPVSGQELCLVSLRDITEQKRLADELIRSEKLAAVGEVTAALAHEVNNPLGALYNAVCLLKSDLELSGDNARLLEMAVEEAAHLSEIVNDFLSFARFPHARLEWYNLNELVSAALFLMKRDERMGDHIEVSVELAENLAACRLDKGQIQEVLFNLITNALDALADGGAMSLRTYNARLDERPAVGLLVEDSGCGMTRENLEKAFAPFFTTKEVGTGLGLSIVKRIVEDHRGTIAIESAPEKGTRVSVVIPVSREDALWRQS